MSYVEIVRNGKRLGVIDENAGVVTTTKEWDAILERRQGVDTEEEATTMDEAAKKGTLPPWLQGKNDKDADDRKGAKKSDKLKNDKDADDKGRGKKGKK